MTLAIAFRWSGRLLGSFYFAFFMFFLMAYVIGGDFPPPQGLSPSEVAIFAAIGVSQVGVLLSWWQGVLGGYVMLAGWASLMCVEWNLVFNIFFGLPAVAGVMLITSPRRPSVS